MTTIQTTLTEKTYFAIGSAPFTDYRDKLPGTEVIYDREQAQLNPTQVEIQLAHASRGTTKAVVHISALDQTPARELAEQEAAASVGEGEVMFDEVSDLLGCDLPEWAITDYTISHTPRVWIGCLACYNHGRLVGAWYDATGAGEATVAEVHRDGGHPHGCKGEELWVFDTNNLGDVGEMAPHEATGWGERYQELSDSKKWPAYLVYNNHFGRNGELPEVRDFEEAYRGRFDEFSDYAYQSAQETGLQEGWSELAQRHFDWDSYTEEVQQDYLVADAHPGCYVFWAHQ